MDKADIGIIGGTGVYNAELLKKAREVSVSTPYGKPSDKILLGEFENRKIAFLPRHGKKHTIAPHMINFRANIYALQKLGVQRILAPQAVGSLKEEYKPGDIVITSQFIDRTHGRESTFYDKGKVCHISVAEPFCPELRALLIGTAKSNLNNWHDKGTYVCIQGPRFSTKAESSLFRQWNADIIGMTLVPECVLAREAQLCYASIAMVTDYDCWRENTEHVTHEEVVKVMKENEDKVKRMLMAVIPEIPYERKCSCKSALEGALI